MRLFLSRFLVFAGFLSAFLAGCGPATESGPAQPRSIESAFFPIDSFFVQELARLDEKRQIRKTIRLNDLEETLSLDSVDLEADFRIFREADINRVAWIDRYQTDTLLKEEGPFSIQVTYKALDAKLKVQEVAVQWDTAGQVSDIRIRKRVKSLIAKSEQQLHYQPAHGYEIQAHQQRIFSKGTTMEVEVAW